MYITTTLLEAVKPLSLMIWLAKLITPPGGTILDCFCGSGTTGLAALNIGANFVGIEAEASYVDIARARLAYAEAQRASMLPFDAIPEEDDGDA